MAGGEIAFQGVAHVFATVHAEGNNVCQNRHGDRQYVEMPYQRTPPRRALTILSGSFQIFLIDFD